MVCSVILRNYPFSSFHRWHWNSFGDVITGITCLTPKDTFYSTTLIDWFVLYERLNNEFLVQDSVHVTLVYSIIDVVVPSLFNVFLTDYFWNKIATAFNHVSARFCYNSNTPIGKQLVNNFSKFRRQLFKGIICWIIVNHRESTSDTQ